MTVWQQSMRSGVRRTMRQRLALEFAALGGIFAWSVHLVVSWGLASNDRGGAASVWLHATTVVCLLIAAGALLTAWSLLRMSAPPAEGSTADSDRFVAVAGLWVGGLMLLLIVVESIGTFVLVGGT